MGDSDSADQPLGLAVSRSRRQKQDKGGRLAAFERLKKLKGSGGKNKYEVTEVDNVYEEVDESEYAERVLQRQEENFIVDDDGTGYVEDGREIFDDDLYVSEEQSSKSKKKHNKSRKRDNLEDEDDGAGSAKKRKAGGDIRKLIGNISHVASFKKKTTEIKKLDEDNDLQEILKELEASPLENKPKNTYPNKNFASPASNHNIITARDSARDYLKTFAPVVGTKRNSYTKLDDPAKHVRKENDNLIINKPLRPSVDIKEEPKVIIDVNKQSCIVEESDMVLDFGDDFDLTKTVVKTEPVDPPEEPKLDEHSMETDLNGFNDDFFIEEFNQQEMKVENGIKQEDINDVKKELLNTVVEGWDDVMKQSDSTAVNEISSFSSIDPSKLPLIDTESHGKVMHFYYLDAHEEYFQQPGVVYLFGKVWDEGTKAFHSCCVTVKDMNRNIYLLPREERINIYTGESTGKEIKMQDVYEEFDTKISNTYKILHYKCRTVTKNYAFNMTDVPFTSEYLQVKYSAKYPKLPADLRGETFSHVFGVNSSFLESLLLDRKIKGPRWLAIKTPEVVTNHVSWCRMEVSCKDIDLFTGDTFNELNDKLPPPLTILTLSARIAHNKRTSNNEIISICGLVHNKFPLDSAPPQRPFQQQFCAMTKMSDRPWPLNFKNHLIKLKSEAMNLEKCDSERALLNYFMARFYRIDPDLIVCHDFIDFELGVLLKKLTDLKIPNWSRLGRLKRANKLQGRTQVIRNSLCGRLVCDMKICAKELVRARSYDLDTLCQEILHMPEGKRESFTQDELLEMLNNSESLIKLMKATVNDALYILKLMVNLNVLPLALQITNVAGNVLSRTLMGGRSERNEFLLLHAFTDKGFIVPEKDYKSSSKEKEEPVDFEDEMTNATTGQNTTKNASGGRTGRRKPAYAGGLVLEPKKGLYDRLVLLMDFNSLYPSIIQEYNICFTTIDRNSAQTDDSMTLNVPSPDAKPGILPSEIRQLVESRRVVKNMMKNPNLSPDVRTQYEIRQLALKLMANSMYGCLGFGNSRFCCKPIAALVTAKGREILMKTKDLVEKMGYEVIYGDTDSLMINTNSVDYNAVKKVGHKIKSEVNRCYKQLELEIDGIFRCILLCKKKKYAASVITGQLPDGTFQLKQEIKGLDVVRRDWCQVSSVAGKFVLAQILSEQETEERIENIHKHLRQLRDDLEKGVTPVTLLTIAKQLAKAPEEYTDRKAQSHVQVALRANAKAGQKRFKAGDTVHYVICEDGTKNPATQRAYLLEELKTNPDLKVDVNYYLEQQVLPVVSRICEPIDGAEPARIAESLGLDYKQYEKTAAMQSYQDDNESKMIMSSDKYKNCEKFSFKCIKCGADNIIEGPTRKLDTGVEVLVLNCCTNPDCLFQPRQYITSIRNTLSLSMRTFIKKYYQGWLKCEDPYCTNRKRRIGLQRKHGQPLCDSCVKHDSYNVMKVEYIDHDLYAQLEYFRSIFDSSKIPSSIRVDTEVLSAYSTLQEDVKNVLSLSAYATVDLSHLFYLLTPFASKKAEKDV